MKKLYFLILLIIPLLFFFGCEDKNIDAREKASFKIKRAFVKKMKIKGLKAIGIGGAERNGKTTQIAVTFTSDQILDIPIARQLAVESAECLLQIICEQKAKDQIYFDPFPPSVNIVRLIIIGKKPNNKSTPYIRSVWVIEDRVTYTKDRHDPNDLSLIIAKEESYEEAKKIVEATKPAS